MTIAVNLPRDERPQDEGLDGAGWTFTTHEHGGDYPDAMPQCILATDPKGRSWFYEASRGP